MVGKPIELIGDALPASARQAITTATSKALQAALRMALRTMPRTDHAGSGLLHKALATASGAAGGAFGLATLPVELPVSTIIMLRSIAEIGTIMYTGLCFGWTRWLGRCFRNRLFRGAGHVSQECN